MANSPVVRLMDSARIQLPGALQGAMNLAFFDVLKHFLQRTNAWQDEITFSATPSVWDYALTPNQTATINRLLWVEGARATTQDASGPIQNGYLTQPGQAANLRIATPPSSAETWYAHVAYSVADPTGGEGVPSVPDWLIEKYQDVLQEGLLERMMIQPAKPYANAQGAMLHGRRYRQGAILARAEVKHGFVSGANNWTFPQTYKTRTQRYFKGGYIGGGQ